MLAGFSRSPLAGRFRMERGTFLPVIRTGHPRAALLSTTTKSSERRLCLGVTHALHAP